jgi:hypothetical protein
MVQFENNYLVIKLDTTTTAKYEDLYNLQSNLIRLIQLRDTGQQTDNLEVYTALELLHSTLIEPEKMPNNFVKEHSYKTKLLSMISPAKQKSSQQ